MAWQLLLLKSFKADFHLVNCRFFFDFSLTYVGAGMIVSHLVNLSLLLGAIISWGITWPLLTNLKGDWYPAKLPESSMRSMAGYKVHLGKIFLVGLQYQYMLTLILLMFISFISQAFLTIALILGDGLYNFAKILIFTSRSLYDKSKSKKIGRGKMMYSHKILLF